MAECGVGAGGAVRISFQHWKGVQPRKMAMAMSPCNRDPWQDANQAMTIPAIRAGIRTMLAAMRISAGRLWLAWNQNAAITVTRRFSATKLHRGMRNLPTMIARRMATGMAIPSDSRLGKSVD